MTCQRSDVYYADALYNAVSKAPGSVQAAAAFLSERRGKSIGAETLRKKLRRLDGESLSMEMAELLTEYLQQFVDTAPIATDWIVSLGCQFNLMVDYVPPAPVGGWPDEIAAMLQKLMEIHRRAGALSGLTADAAADREIDLAEADAMQDLTREMRTLCFRFERNARRLAQRSRVG